MNNLEEKLSELFDELVPGYGKADTVAGEIVRATNRIAYRYYNDGDHIGVGYGRETCNPAARYLAEKAGDGVARAIQDAWGESDDSAYENALIDLEDQVLHYLEEHPELKQTPNTEDMFDYRDSDEDVDRDDDEDDW